eukprot:1702312-Rhodomonas_salina.1
MSRLAVAVWAVAFLCLTTGVNGQQTCANDTTHYTPRSHGTFTSCDWYSVWSCAIFESQKMKCWGANGQGQLGYGDSGSSAHRGNNPGEMGANLPFLDLPGPVKSVACAQKTAFALLDSGELLTWGANSYSLMGITGGPSFFATPQTVDFNFQSKIRLMGSGPYVACVVLENHELYCWGFNFLDDLSPIIPKGSQTAIPLKVDLGNGIYPVQMEFAQAVTCFLTNLATVKCMGQDAPVPDETRFSYYGLRDIDFGFAVIEIMVTRHVLCARSVSGQWKCAGRVVYLLDNGIFNSKHPTARVPSQTDTTIAETIPFMNFGAGVSASTLGSCSLDSNFLCASLSTGVVKCWGYNVRGALGIGAGTTGTSTSNSLLVRRNDASTVQAVDIGGAIISHLRYTSETVLALTTEGNLYGWGSNYNGFLGQGDTIHRDVPVPIDVGGKILQGVCTECTTCVAGVTYKGANCAGSQDTICLPCTVCGSGYYADSQCTPTRDTGCAACSTCPHLQYRSGLCTSLQDTECEVCRVTCPGGQFISADCSATEDTQCSSVCPPTTFGNTSSGRCEPCPADFFCSDNAASPCLFDSTAATGSAATKFDCVCDAACQEQCAAGSEFSLAPENC